MTKQEITATTEETLYRINGTLMRIAQSIEDQNKLIEKCNWNFGSIVQELKKRP